MKLMEAVLDQRIAMVAFHNTEKKIRTIQCKFGFHICVTCRQKVDSSSIGAKAAPKAP